jgi:hypothetical protein
VDRCVLLAAALKPGTRLLAREDFSNVGVVLSGIFNLFVTFIF